MLVLLICRCRLTHLKQFNWKSLKSLYGDFEIIQQEIEYAATMKNIFLLRLLSKAYVTEKNQVTANTSSSSENISNSHISTLAQNQARLSEIIDRLSSQSSPGPVGNTTGNLPTVSMPTFNGNYLELTVVFRTYLYP
jgi:hypothetical protein